MAVGDLLEVLAFGRALWREIVGALAGLAVAFVLSLVFRNLPAGAWFALALVGASAGVVWHAVVVSARKPPSDKATPRLSRPTSFAAIALIGGVWGGLVAGGFGVTAAVACLILAPWLLGPLFGAIAKHPVTLSTIAFATAASLVGFAVPYAIQYAFQA